MTHSSITHGWILLGALLLAGAACDKASDDERRANVAAAEANEKIAAATREADEKIAAANAGFAQLREEYRHDTTIKLVDVDRDVEALSSRTESATGQQRADLDARLSRVRALRAAFAADYGSLDGATGAAWDETKARLDKELRDLRALIDAD